MNDLRPWNPAPQYFDSLRRELAAEILRNFSEVQFVARGTSMLPSIYPGDCLTVKSLGATAPCCGDIVLCRRAGEFRVHRIVSILEGETAKFYVLRGDALTEDDPPVPADDLLGRVTSIVRRGRSIELNSPRRVLHRFLRPLVRHSKIAAVLLLRWHAAQSRYFLHSESSSSSAEFRSECA